MTASINKTILLSEHNVKSEKPIQLLLHCKRVPRTTAVTTPFSLCLPQTSIIHLHQYSDMSPGTPSVLGKNFTRFQPTTMFSHRLIAKVASDDCNGCWRDEEKSGGREMSHLEPFTKWEFVRVNALNAPSARFFLSLNHLFQVFIESEKKWCSIVGRACDQYQSGWLCVKQFNLYNDGMTEIICKYFVKEIL